MAIFKEQTAPRKDPSPVSSEQFPRKDSESFSSPAPSYEPRPRSKEAKESVIAAGLTIDGKIEGAGHVRMAGRFKGDVNVDGDLTIEPGAKITGSVRADTVTVGGELEGNIDSRVTRRAARHRRSQRRSQGRLSHRRERVPHARQRRVRVG